MFKRFIEDKSGNVAIIVAAFAIILFAVAGGAVDFIRFTTIRGEMQSAIDSSVLAAASLSNNGDEETIVNEYFNNNFEKERFSLNTVSVSTTVVSDSTFLKTVEASASTQMPTFFLGVLNIISGGSSFSTLDINVDSRATDRSQNIEIALVLDVSISMEGARIDNLRSAAISFVNQILDDADPGQTSISIIPFASNVNVAPIVNDFIDTTVTTLPVGRPCLLYEDIDFNEELITTNRDLVAQIRPITSSRDACTSSEVIFNTDNRGNLTSAINALNAQGRTDAHIGLMWGVKALSPNFQGMLLGDFSNRPNLYRRRTLKALVVMSDGNMNPIPNADGSSSLATANSQFTDLCNEARSNNIFVYTIGFQIATGSPADQLLSDCASNLSQYFQVETLDIATAFEGIAASILGVRITE